MTHRNRTTGFTLVELMLSMAFIAVLLLAIALLVLQISGIYNKGLTIRAVNEAGQLITSDIQRTLNTSVPEQVIYYEEEVAEPTGGRLCAGATVYAWNYGNELGGNAFNKNKEGSTDIPLVTFDKGEDDVDEYCEPDALTGLYPDIPNDATELLSNNDTNLALHGFSLNEVDSDGVPGEPVTGDSTQRLYAFSITIGTNEDDFILANGCTQPKSNVDDQYCSVNTFKFVARAGNKG